MQMCKLLEEQRFERTFVQHRLFGESHEAPQRRGPYGGPVHEEDLLSCAAQCPREADDRVGRDSSARVRPRGREARHGERHVRHEDRG